MRQKLWRVRWWIAGAGAVALLLGMTSAANRTEEARCLASGRGWAVAGQRQQTTILPVGKVMVPQTTTITEYGCFEVRR